MRLLIKMAIYTVLFLAIARLIPNMFYVDSLTTAILASFVLIVLNWTIKPILHLISLPITFITFGLFSFVISAATLEITSSLMGPTTFYFSSFGAAIVVAIILAICNSVINRYTSDNFNKRV